MPGFQIWGRVRFQAVQARRGTVRVVPVIVYFVIVGETVEQQEIQHLVLPCGWGRGKRSPRQGSEIQIVQAFLDVLYHRTLQADQI